MPDAVNIESPAQRALAAPRHIILCCDCEGTLRQNERLVGAIERAGIAANFFYVGETALMEPELVREVATRHQVESHTMTHARLRRLTKAGQRQEILDGKAAVEGIIQRPTRGFRAPCHGLNRDTVAVLNEEGFTFDASRLYFRYDMGGVEEIEPTWFREWMPLYGMLGLSPDTCFGVFRFLVRRCRLAVLPAHPHYAGMSDAMARAFEDFLKWSVDQGAVFWPIDHWLHTTRNVPMPEWISPLGPVKKPRIDKALILEQTAV